MFRQLLGAHPSTCLPRWPRCAGRLRQTAPTSPLAQNEQGSKNHSPTNHQPHMISIQRSHHNGAACIGSSAGLTQKQIARKGSHTDLIIGSFSVAKRGASECVLLAVPHPCPSPNSEASPLADLCELPILAVRDVRLTGSADSHEQREQVHRPQPHLGFGVLLWCLSLPLS
jgi:hypothetical protein